MVDVDVEKPLRHGPRRREVAAELACPGDVDAGSINLESCERLLARELLHDRQRGLGTSVVDEDDPHAGRIFVPLLDLPPEHADVAVVRHAKRDLFERHRPMRCCHYILQYCATHGYLRCTSALHGGECPAVNTRRVEGCGPACNQLTFTSPSCTPRDPSGGKSLNVIHAWSEPVPDDVAASAGDVSGSNSSHTSGCDPVRSRYAPPLSFGSLSSTHPTKSSSRS